MKRTALFLLGFVLVSMRLLAQGNCTPEKAEVDKLEQWTSFDRDHGNATLPANKSKLADAIKSLDRCQHSVHSTEIGDDGQIITVGSETCYKPREYARYVNSGASLKVKEIFESKVDFETMYKKVSDSNAVVDAVATSLFSACFDLGTGKISPADYQKSRKVYEQLLTESLKPRPPAPEPVTAVVPQYLDKDQATNQPFETNVAFKVGDHADPNKLEGGDPKTPGHPWSFSWTAPGPVADVHMADQNPGWEGEHPCTKDGNVATCTGWINGSNPTRSMYVRWVQKNPDYKE